MEIIFRAEAKDPEALAAREAEYKARFANPFVAASRGYIDDVIMPHGTRKRLIRALKSLKGKELSNPWKEARQHPAVGRGSSSRSVRRSGRQAVPRAIVASMRVAACGQGQGDDDGPIAKDAWIPRTLNRSGSSKVRTRLQASLALEFVAAVQRDRAGARRSQQSSAIPN